MYNTLGPIRICGEFYMGPSQTPCQQYKCLVTVICKKYAGCIDIYLYIINVVNNEMQPCSLYYHDRWLTEVIRNPRRFIYTTLHLLDRKLELKCAMSILELSWHKYGKQTGDRV